MPSLNNLPVELVVKILKGASLQDILSVTRTCTSFRALGFLSRSLWVSAHDAYRLPLPLGETLETVPLASISRLAAYAAAISAVWRGSVARPRRISNTAPYPHRRSPSFDSANGVVLPGNQWLLVDMNVRPRLYCMKDGKSLPLMIDRTVRSYVFESSDNGYTVTLALLSVGNDLGLMVFLEVYVLKFDFLRPFRNVPHVRRVLSVQIKAIDLFQFWRPPVHLDMKGSLVVVAYGNELFVVNWEERSGVMLSPYLHLPPEEEQTSQEFSSMRFYWKPCFHPERSLILAEKIYHSCTSIHSINFLSSLHPLGSSASDTIREDLIWPTELLVSTHIHTMTIGSHRETLHRGFRSPDGGPLILDLLYSHHLPYCADHTSIISPSDQEDSFPETSRRVIHAKKFTFERRTTSGRTICLGIDDSEHPSAIRSRRRAIRMYSGDGAGTRIWIWMSTSIYRLSRLSKRILNQSSASRPNWLFFLRMPEERSGQGKRHNQEDPTWMRLELPNGVLVDEVSPESVLAFDDVYGTLLLLDTKKKNYYIVQY